MPSRKGASYKKKVKRITVKKHNRRRNTKKMAKRRRMRSMKGGAVGVISIQSARDPNDEMFVPIKSVVSMKKRYVPQLSLKNNKNINVTSETLETGFLKLFNEQVSNKQNNTTPKLIDVQITVQDAVSSVASIKMRCPNKPQEWKTCGGECYEVLSKLIQTELTSTAYMLRTISQSLLWADKKNTDKPRVTFEFSAKLTGVWENDKDKIIMHLLDENEQPIDVNANTQLINAFGPSASGKTYWAQQIINIFSSADRAFPKVFIAIDGGIFRETSIIYSWIVRATQYACMNGLSNLVSASFIGPKSLFKSRIVKKAFIDFLTKQKINTPISLYVPETLGSCGWGRVTRLFRKKPCIEKYNKYIDIVTKSGKPKKNNWIALFIYQHKIGGIKCPYADKYKCIGCTESGQSRELKEGKKYSSGAYEHSINKIKHIFKTIGPIFVIHNTGARDKLATVYDFSLKLETQKDIMRSYFEQPTDAQVNDQIHYNNTVSAKIAEKDNKNNPILRYVDLTTQNMGSDTHIKLQNDQTFINMDEEDRSEPQSVDAEDDPDDDDE